MGIVDRSESRDGYAVRVLAVHTSEGFDKPVVDDAAALRDAAWWEGSSHAIADNDPGSLLTPAQGCVPYDRASWTLRSGNRWSENIELVAQAGWTRAQWLARPTLLDRCAYWLAVRSKVDRGGGRRIPLVKLTAAQYRAGAWGVIGHHDHTVGYSDGTHWDPGPGFPWDVVLDKARAYAGGSPIQEDDDDMPTLAEIHDAIWHGTPGAKLIPNHRLARGEWAATILGALEKRVRDEILAPPVAALRGEIAGLSKALEQLARAPGQAIDLASVRAAAHAGAQEALAAGVDVDITVGGQATNPTT